MTTINPQFNFWNIPYRNFTYIAMESVPEYINYPKIMKERKYENFDIIFDDLTVGKELCYCEDINKIFYW
jgi:hypothetical protein